MAPGWKEGRVRREGPRAVRAQGQGGKKTPVVVVPEEVEGGGAEGGEIVPGGDGARGVGEGGWQRAASLVNGGGVRWWIHIRLIHHEEKVCGVCVCGGGNRVDGLGKGCATQRQMVEGEKGGSMVHMTYIGRMGA